MNPRDIEERINYITSLNFLFNDRYKIWSIDSFGIIFGLIFMLLGFLNYSLSGLLRLVFIILGAILFVASAIRIDRRYTKFKNKIFKDIESLAKG